MLQVLTAIGSIATPILVLVLTGIGWRVRTDLERRAKLEDILRSDRLRVYNDILEPFMILFSPDAAWENKEKKDAAFRSKMISMEYRKHAFLLALFGSDDVVRAYNAMMQNFSMRRVDQATLQWI